MIRLENFFSALNKKRVRYLIFLLDVFIEMLFDFKKVYDVREKMKAGNIVIPVIPLKYLIEIKDKTDRPQDKADAYYLKKSKTGERIKTEPLLYYKTEKEIEAYR